MRCSLGEYSYWDKRPRVRTWGEDTQLIIGRFCSIADDVDIFLGGNHPSDRIVQWPIRHFLLEEANADVKTKGNVVIHNDVWVAAGVTILSGVTVGNGAVLAAKSVITKDVPDYAIVVGNPGRVVKYRFTTEEIEILLKVQWWNWPIEKIKNNIDILCSNNVNKLLEIANE